MKTLVLIGHPSPRESFAHQFLLESLKYLNEIDVKIISELETFNQNDLQVYDRIILQIPIYWYSAPGFVKTFLDDILVSDSNLLTDKYFGIVATFGTQEKAFQAGGKEKFTVSEMLRPFEMIANHFGMQYLPPFAIHQFDHMTPEEREKLLIDYQLYISAPPQYSFSQKGDWLVAQLKKLTSDTQWLEDMIIDNNEDIDNLVSLIEEVE